MISCCYTKSEVQAVGVFSATQQALIFGSVCVFFFVLGGDWLQFSGGNLVCSMLSSCYGCPSKAPKMIRDVIDVSIVI